MADIGQKEQYQYSEGTLESPEQVKDLIESLEASQEESDFKKEVNRVISAIRKFKDRDLVDRFLNSTLNYQEIHGTTFTESKDYVRSLLTDYICWSLEEKKNIAVIRADMDALGKINSLYGDDGGDKAIRVWLREVTRLFRLAAGIEESSLRDNPFGEINPIKIEHLFFLKRPGTRSDELEIVLSGNFTQQEIKDLINRVNTVKIAVKLQPLGKEEEETFQVTAKAGLAFKTGDGVTRDDQEEKWSLVQKLEAQANDGLFQAKKQALESSIEEIKEKESPTDILERIVHFASWRKLTPEQVLELLSLYRKVLWQDRAKKRKEAFSKEFSGKQPKKEEVLAWFDQWEENYNRKVEEFVNELRRKLKG